MRLLRYAEGDWSFDSAQQAIVTRFAIIPLGPKGFHIHRLGEHDWQIAPVKGALTREPYDAAGEVYDFLHLAGAPAEVSERIDELVRVRGR